MKRINFNVKDELQKELNDYCKRNNESKKVMLTNLLEQKLNGSQSGYNPDTVQAQLKLMKSINNLTDAVNRHGNNLNQVAKDFNTGVSPNTNEVKKSLSESKESINRANRAIGKLEHTLVVKQARDMKLARKFESAMSADKEFLKMFGGKVKQS